MEIDQASLSARIGEAVRTLRVARGLTQSELGARIGYGQAGVSGIERGVKRLDDLLLFARIADALGMSRVGLFTLLAKSVPDGKEIGDETQIPSPVYPDEARPENSTSDRLRGEG